MKPPKFEYYAPETTAEATELLRQNGAEAKVLAGGQSLMPLLNMRLVRPQVIVDINGVRDLEYTSATPDGGLVIGALTRQRSLEQDPLVGERFPIIPLAMSHLGHVQIRNRGTIGGSLAHADPAAELPALALALDAQVILTSNGNQRTVEARDFFLAPLTVIMEPEELLTEIRIPPLHGDWRWGFQEVCRRDGDFALVGAAILLRLDQDGACAECRLSMFGVAPTPVRLAEVEEMLAGQRLDNQLLAQAGQMAAQTLEPESDIHASAAYRKEVGGVVARRTLALALGNSPPEN